MTLHTKEGDAAPEAVAAAGSPTGASSRAVVAPHGGRRSWPAVVAFVAAVCAPFANALGAYARGWVPYGDEAIIATRAYDVGTRLTPLLGMPSTYGEVSAYNPSQPGPLQFWGLAPFVRTLGPSAGVLVGTAAFNAAAMAVVGAVLWRRLGRGAALMGVAACLVATLYVNGPGSSFRVINSIAPLLPYVATMVLAWAVADGGLAWLAPLVVFGSFAAQGDLEFLGVVIIVVGWALISLCVVRWRRRALTTSYGSGRGRRLRHGPLPVALGFLALAACWSGPIAQAAHHHGGNLRLIVDAFLAPAKLLGFTGSAQALGAILNLPPYNVSIHSAGRWQAGLNPTAAVPLVLLAALTWWSARRREPRLRRLLTSAWVVLLAVAANGYRFPVVAFEVNHTVFAQGAMVFVWAVIVVAAWRWLRAVLSPFASAQVATVGACIAVLPAFRGMSGLDATIIHSVSVAVALAMLVLTTVAIALHHLRRGGPLDAHGVALRAGSRPTACVAALTTLLAVLVGLPPKLQPSYLSWTYLATPSLTRQVVNHLPTSGPGTAFLVVNGGGEKYRLELQGLVTQLQSRGVPFLVERSYDTTYGPRRTYHANPASARGMLALLPAFATDPPPGSRRLALWQPPGWTDQQQRRLDQEIDAYVQRTGGLRLTSDASSRVADVLRFVVPTTNASGEPDPTPYQDDPRRFLAIPGTLTNLYQEGWVASPALPADLQAQVNALNQHGMAITVWFVPGPFPLDVGG